MAQELSKRYDASLIEDKWYQHWLEQNYFHSEPDENKTPYTIVIPPPNVTGILTLGHVLNNTMQDILIRWRRMQGREACWIPGTDHASIATETKVVNMLREKGITKHEIGRDAFLEHAWEWKEKYGGIIIEQLKKLGASCDWERERFTMDDDYYQAVLHSFVELYHAGYIYRGKRLVNWCPKTKSAISDEEVIYQERNSHLWYMRYPVKDSHEVLVVATTRPETMLGDSGVAVHPDDDRYKHLIGKHVVLPLVGREIPIFADEYVDKDFGTGCVKVTPSHDPNDWEMGKRHNLEFINIFNEDASLNNNVPGKFIGLDRFEAREMVIEQLNELNLMDKIEDYVHKVGYSERGNVPIEPYESEQWFMNMTELVKPALQAVRDDKIKFHPAHWTKTYEHWMSNIKDWCISRQLWWGHRIPVYTCQDCHEMMVQVETPTVCIKCSSTNLKQDEDVLDTWSSSWLWPFAVHQWPGDSKDLDYYYPTNDLVTAPDIIFFWVARMIMAGYQFKGDIPFENVYFTSIIRDAEGRKMSKSLGNSPDPLDLIEKYGADALRFGVMLIAPKGQDILFTEERLDVARNFMNKVWNASRFVLMNKDFDLTSDHLNPEKWQNLELADRWILHRLNATIARVTQELENFSFDETARSLWDFIWNDFCDWYIEMIKMRLYDGTEAQKQTAMSVAIYVLRDIMKMLHPYAPFISEEIWQQVKLSDEPDLIVAPWPTVIESFHAPAEAQETDFLKKVITAVRTIRSEMNVPPSQGIKLVGRVHSQTQLDILSKTRDTIAKLTRCDDIELGLDIKKPGFSASAMVEKMELFVPLEGLIDLEKEIERLEQEIVATEGFLKSVQGKLANKSFVDRAPEAVVAKERDKLDHYTQSLAKLRAHIETMKAL
ncbi:MAG: valine--tRNA ligase [Candidatus Marinimicrobia bacterium]|nr:valine--tRNA ligase [Candidatus Neomarinimicrobiota bacterium]MCF7923116.1 valine--tRNA ligase [Candidatus Neomarinimicrobiota bacterium]